MILPTQLLIYLATLLPEVLPPNFRVVGHPYGWLKKNKLEPAPEILAETKRDVLQISYSLEDYDGFFNVKSLLTSTAVPESPTISRLLYTMGRKFALSPHPREIPDNYVLIVVQHELGDEILEYSEDEEIVGEAPVGRSRSRSSEILE